MQTTQVFIAGGGPVGMTLALELAHHGIRSVLVEQNSITTKHPKMDLTNGRSMELYRRLGISDDLRAVGVASDQALDIVWATSATGHALHRFAYPSPDAQREMTRVQNDGTGTLEPGLRVSQIVIEPVLKKHIDASPLIDVKFGWKFVALEQDEEGVTATIENAQSGNQEKVHATYLAGCDGGASQVRREIDISLDGQFGVADAYMVHFRSTDYDVLAKFGIAYHLQTELGTVIAQDGKEVWTLQAMAPTDADPNALLKAFYGQSFDYEILVANPWKPHVVVAQSYRQGNVFLAGDAAHQLVPTGGYGMNTGIGDAVDLGWKLAANLNGWGGDLLLDSYDCERRSIGARNVGMSMEHVGVRVAISTAIATAKAECDLDSNSAADRRAALREFVQQSGNAENESWGIEHGYTYFGSPVILSEGSEPPELDPAISPPRAAPGFRVPNLYLANGQALLDLIDSKSLNLIAIGDVETDPLEREAAQIKIPLNLIRLEREPILKHLENDLLLVRPDHHVAWRGMSVSSDSAKILKTVAGR